MKDHFLHHFGELILTFLKDQLLELNYCDISFYNLSWTLRDRFVVLCRTQFLFLQVKFSRFLKCHPMILICQSDRSHVFAKKANVVIFIIANWQMARDVLQFISAFYSRHSDLAFKFHKPKQQKKKIKPN